MRIVFATAEVSPIAKSGGLGDVCGSLPKELRTLGHEVVIFMPCYRQALDFFEREGVPLETAHPPITVTWANWAAEAEYLRTTLPGSDATIILVGNEHFFDREAIYATRNGFEDFLHRYTFFCRAVVRGCEILGIEPDVLHAHDWHTALLPVYLHSGLRDGSPTFRGTRSVYTIHNLNYQGTAGPAAFVLTGLHSRYWAADAVEHFGEVNPMKGGLLFADQVTTVSPTYAREIQTPAHGAGLDGVLRTISPKLTGILNGIDQSEWDPASDSHLPAPFTREDLQGKAACKKALLEEAGLPLRHRTPLVGVVSRLVEQKGFQLLLPVVGKILQAGAQLVILGSGEPHYEDAFRAVAEEYPQSCRAWIGFDNPLAHRIVAGSDVMLMPSIYEPCGLNQMYALRYGTLPLVRLTGGLADTVIPFDGTNAAGANGFGFVAPDPSALYAAAWTALLNFRHTRVWRTLQSNGMETDFSWRRSAAQYERVYERARTA